MLILSLAFEADGVTIKEWGECLPDCPSEEADIVCLDPPEFPRVSFAQLLIFLLKVWIMHFLTRKDYTLVYRYGTNSP